MFQYVSEDPQLLEEADTSLLIPDYLAYRLTGRQVAEVSNASTTQLLNIHHRDYDYDLLDLAGIKASQLPDLVETGDLSWTPTSREISRITNFLMLKFMLWQTQIRLQQLWEFQRQAKMLLISLVAPGP